MATTTTNLGLKKPATTDYYNIQDFNDNSDILDTFAGNAITTDKLINNLASTEPGFGLDARQGKAIQDEINAVITDNTRTTTSKTVTGAINELNSNKAPLASPNFSGAPQISSHNIVQALNGGYKIQSGNTSISNLNANTQGSINITFPSAFGNTPIIIFQISGVAVNSTYVTIQYTATTSGATVYVESGATQSFININWIALGN